MPFPLESSLCVIAKSTQQKQEFELEQHVFFCWLVPFAGAGAARAAAAAVVVSATHPRQVATPAPAPGTRVFGDSFSDVEIGPNDVKKKENFGIK